MFTDVRDHDHMWRCLSLCLLSVVGAFRLPTHVPCTAAAATAAAAAAAAASSSSSARRRAPPPCLGLFDSALDWLDVQLQRRREEREGGSQSATSERVPAPKVDLRPKRIVLVRHGQSEGNVDSQLYSQTPDSQIALTERGYAQASVAGLQIRELVGNESVRFFYSPYLRAQQTLLAMLQAFDGQTVQISSEPRLREQDFGNFQDPATMSQMLFERQKFGRFYFRFPNGEAGTDVFDRVASFITYLFRTMGDRGYFAESLGAREFSPAQNYVLVTHGLLMRIFCMCYLRWTVKEFEGVWNPSNCEIWVLQRIEGRATYEVTAPYPRPSPSPPNALRCAAHASCRDALRCPCLPVEMFSQASLTRLPVASDPLLRAPCAPPSSRGGGAHRRMAADSRMCPLARTRRSRCSST